jgi:hypothetical protein
LCTAQSLLGKPARREDFGLPNNWARVKSWINFRGEIRLNKTGISGQKNLKWPEIPALQDYKTSPDPSFWENFPKKDLPTSAETEINVTALEERVKALKSSMTIHQFERSMKAVDYLKNGAPAFQKNTLPGCFVKNADSTLRYGKEITDNIATWVKEGYAAGPFDSPPCANFRVNPLIAVVQPGKVRPVLDVSSPSGESFNSSVSEHETETVKMASARQFSQLILDCGHGALMSKHDLVAAYKQVPCRVADLRLQGFSWLGKYFVETRQVFGAKTSVCNYDIVGETLKLIALIESEIPATFVLRQVDDVPVVAPEKSGLCENFSATYKKVCGELNVKLAPDCPIMDKAFTCQKRGKVLGVKFDSTDLTWSLSDKKIQNALGSVKMAVTNDDISLKDCQRLVGRLNDVGQLCPFMKIFKQPISQCLAAIPSNADPGTRVEISAEAKDDLLVWAGFLSSEFRWLPINREVHAPPIRYKEFVTDAAGLSDTADSWKLPGCGCVGFGEDGTVIFANQLLWPERFISNGIDEKNVRFGDKTTTLEMIGLLMPMILAPELFKNSNVVMKVDCFGTVYSMTNRMCKGDKTAAIFVRAAYLISAYLECHLHIEQLPRMSDWGAEVADRLSRESSTTAQDKKLLGAFKNRSIPPCLESWFKNPVNDWSLAIKLLEHVEKLV